MSLRKVCKATGCGALAIENKNYCPRHMYLEAKDRENKAKWTDASQGWHSFYCSPKWKMLRAKQLQQEPLCANCGQPATEVHHRVAHRGCPDLFFDSANLVSLCHDCHTAETRKEIKARQERWKQAQRGKLWY